MNFRQLQKKSTSHFYGLMLDKYFPKMLRNILRKLVAVLAIAFFALSFDTLPLYFGKADGMFFVCIFVYLSLVFLEFFYRSMIGEGVSVKIAEKLADQTPLDLALSDLVFATDEIDVTRALFETKLGLKILARLGLDREVCHQFIYESRPPIMSSVLNLEGEVITLSQYVLAIYDLDKSFQSFLATHQISRPELQGATDWVSQNETKKRRADRFWSRENLGAIPSIGKSWSYGVATDLGKYGATFLSNHEVALFNIENGYREKEVAWLESVLLRKEEANAIIIDDDESVARDIVARFVKKIKLGIVMPVLEHKEVIELNWHALFADFKNRNEVEAELLKILNQSTNAGNVIIFIRDLSSLVSTVKNLGGNFGSLVAPYLASPQLQIIASTTNTDFHFFIETSPALLQRFERIIPDQVGVEASIPVLLEQVPMLEKQYPVFFSYQSILALANSADRFLSYGEMPSKALDLLLEIAPWAVEHHYKLLKENEVMIFVSEKTGIASGPLKERETKQIEHLEELLHERVIGQVEAVSSVASAIRRARSGIGNPKRPLASFIFLGPTGVGKTEVAKALAESFFGNENKMIRFDMSEYSGPNALSQLIGDFPSNKTGLLANKVKDNPYNVLLLDEFEKSAPDVLDLFLQILDEGVFTDAFGRIVGCRNLIIIATSNAGSDLIWQMAKTKDLNKEKSKIINQIIERKIFRPELLNRFDEIALFHPLIAGELKQIAELGLQKLQKRLLEQNIELVVNSDLIDFLAQKGSDPEFGGRAVNRLIQNEVEDLIARKIVSGEAKPGSKIELKKEELV
jgi:ATP-dependent Clp protease ATP-binding subunit ClpC